MKKQKTGISWLLGILLCLLSSNVIAFPARKAPDLVIEFTENESEFLSNIDRSQNTKEYIAAYNRYMEFLDKELNKAYKIVKSKLKTKQQLELKKSQREWLKFRDTELTLINSWNLKNYGSSAKMSPDGYSCNIVKNRVLQLLHYAMTTTNKKQSKPKYPDYSKVHRDWRSFIPAEYELVEKIAADVNEDGKEDIILHLGEKELEKYKDDHNHDRNAILTVVLNTKKGYRKIAEAKDLLMCFGCAGMMGGASFPSGVSYENNLLAVDWWSGSRFSNYVVLHFKFDKSTNTFLLQKEHAEVRDRVAGISTIIKTDYVSGIEMIDSETKKIEKKKIRIEDVDWGDYCIDYTIINR